MSVKSDAALSEALESVRVAERNLVALKGRGGETIDAGSAQADAVREFAQTLQEVLGDRDLDAAAGRRAALAAAARTVWDDAVGPLLSGGLARDLLGGVSRQRLGQLVKDGQLIALPQRSGSRAFPAWQFDEDGRPLTDLVRAHRTLVADGEMSAWTAASWFTHPHPELDGSTPLDWVRTGNDPDRLHIAAGRDAARAAQ